MMPSKLSTRRPPAELIISWPDKTETRHVRPYTRDTAEGHAQDTSPEFADEDYRVVTECAPYTASFNHLLSERRANEDPRRFATLVYERMRSDGVPLNTETYNLLMRRLVRFTDGAVFDLYEQLKAEGMAEAGSVRPNKETFVLLFRACERNAEYHRAFLLYQQMRELFRLTPDTATYNTLIGFCAAVKDVAQACYFVDEMKTLGVPMDANTYNCFMSVLVDSAPYEETLAVFNRMCDDGAAPTLRTYNTLLRAMRAHGDFDKAFQIYEEMKKKGHVPDIVTYNTLLWLCEDRLDYVLGTKKFAHLRRSQEQKATGAAAVANLALTLLAEITAAGLVPNTFSYNKVLSVLLICEDPRIFDIHRRVQEAYGVSVRPTGSTARRSLARPSPRRTSSPSTPGEASNQTSAASSPKGPPSRASFATSDLPAPARQPPSASVTGETLADAGRALESAMREEDPVSVGCIRGDGVRPNLETEKLMVRAFLLFGQPENCKAVHLKNRQLFEPFRLTRDLAILLLEVCERTGDRAWAESILQEAVALKLRMDTELFNAYLTVLASVADPTLLEHFANMKLGIHKLAVTADTRTCNIVLRAHVQQRETAAGLALYADMCEPYATYVGDLTPDDETLELVILLYGLVDDVDGATEAVERRLAKRQSVGLPAFHELLRLYGRKKDTRTEECFNRLRAGGGTGGLPVVDAECYAIAMEYYYAVKRYELVSKLFIELKTSQTLEPNVAVYRVVFDMYRAQGNRKAITALFDDARMNSVKLDLTMYNSILEPFVDAGDPFVFEVLGEMRENGIPPGDTTMAIFLATAIGRKQLAEAVSHHLFYKTARNSF